MGFDPLAGVAAVTIFATVFLVILAVVSGAGGGASLARQRLETFKRGQADQAPPADATFTKRALGPLLQGAAEGLGKLLPTSLLKGVERQLVTAGEPMTLNGFLTLVVISTTASIGFALMLIIAAASSLGPVQMAMIGGISLVGFALPFWIVRSRAGQRQHSIIKSLPDAFDLLTACVEAGLGLDAALARVAEKVPGPFAQELQRALRDVSLGKARRDSLKELGERTNVPDLVQFTNAVIQAEAMGSSIGTVLRVQSDQLRVKRRQRAEEAAYKAPVKMIFPLVLCIFPTLFIVILGPAAITFKEGIPK